MAKKKRTKTSYGKKACEVMQLYAKLIESDDNGYGKCCSCGKIKHMSDANGGHFQPKTNKYNAACVDPRNIHFQCKHCNAFMEGNPAGYTLFMIDKYGEGIIEELYLLSKLPGDRNVFIDVIDKYRKINKELAKQKTFEVRLK